MARTEGRLWLGVGLLLAATLMFAMGDTVAKHLAMLYAVPLILTMRGLVTMGLLAAVQGPRLGRGLWATRRTGLVVLRGLCLAAASLTMGLALRVMPLGETVAFIYLSPFAVMLLAGPLLGERVTVLAWISAAVAFGGVLLIARPGSGLDPVGVMLAVTNAGLATVFSLLTRVLSRTETATAMTFHTALVGAVVFCGLTLLSPPEVWPDAEGWALMVVLGVMATGGHFLFAAAYGHAPAPVLAPISYVHLVWAAGLGWLVFAHRPDGLTTLGMALVLAGGALGALRANAGRVRLGRVTPPAGPV